MKEIIDTASNPYFNEANNPYSTINRDQTATLLHEEGVHVIDNNPPLRSGLNYQDDDEVIFSTPSTNNFEIAMHLENNGEIYPNSNF